MQNTQQSVRASKQGKSKAEDTSEPLEPPMTREVVENEESKPLSCDTTQTVTIERPSTETLENTGSPTLRLQASLLAGALSDWMLVKGARAKTQVITLTQPGGKKYKAIKVFIAVDGADIEVVETPDGQEFVVEGKRLVVGEASE